MHSIFDLKVDISLIEGSLRLFPSEHIKNRDIIPHIGWRPDHGSSLSLAPVQVNLGIQSNGINILILDVKSFVSVQPIERKIFAHLLVWEAATNGLFLTPDKPGRLAIAEWAMDRGGEYPETHVLNLYHCLLTGKSHQFIPVLPAEERVLLSKPDGYPLDPLPETGLTIKIKPRSRSGHNLQPKCAV